MFVFSLKADRTKLTIGLIAVFIALSIAVLVFSAKNKPVVNNGDISFKASNAEERITFLSQFGWKINTEPVEVTEVIIPSEFNEKYNEYNEIQKKQGLNLELYKGVRAKKWVYEILNYPGYAQNSGCIMATLLIYDNLVIGGDVSSLEVNGFMQDFDFPQETVTTLNEAQNNRKTP